MQVLLSKRVLTGLTCLLVTLFAMAGWRWCLHADGVRKWWAARTAIQGQDWYQGADSFLAARMPGSVRHQKILHDFDRVHGHVIETVPSIGEWEHQPWLCGCAAVPTSVIQAKDQLDDVHKELVALLHDPNWGAQFAAHWASSASYTTGKAWFEASLEDSLGGMEGGLVVLSAVKLISWKAALVDDPSEELLNLVKAEQRLLPCSSMMDVNFLLGILGTREEAWVREIRRGRVSAPFMQHWTGAAIDFAALREAVFLNELLLSNPMKLLASDASHPDRPEYIKWWDGFQGQSPMMIEPTLYPPFLGMPELRLYSHPDYVHAHRDAALLSRYYVALRDYWLADPGRLQCKEPRSADVQKTMHDTLPAINSSLRHIEDLLFNIYSHEARFRAARLAARLWLELHHGLPLPVNGDDLPAELCDPHPSDPRFARLNYRLRPKGGFDISIDMTKAMPPSIADKLANGGRRLLTSQAPWQHRPGPRPRARGSRTLDDTRAESP